MEQRNNAYGALVAAAQVSSVGAFLGERLGFSGVSPAISVFTLTLENQIDVNDSVVFAGINGATAGSATVEHSADDTIIVRTFGVAGEAAALPFKVGVFRHGVGVGDRP